jgi:hypothetical protein
MQESSKSTYGIGETLYYTSNNIIYRMTVDRIDMKEDTESYIEVNNGSISVAKPLTEIICNENDIENDGQYGDKTKKEVILKLLSEKVIDDYSFDSGVSDDLEP